MTKNECGSELAYGYRLFHGTSWTATLSLILSSAKMIRIPHIEQCDI